jgi:hypothetical protein
MADDQDTSHNPSSEDRDARHRTVGLLTSPGLGERLAQDISETLPESLKDHISDEVEWNVGIAADPLTGSNVAVDEILDEIAAKKSLHG